MAGRVIKATIFGLVFGQVVNVTPHFTVNDLSGDYQSMVDEVFAGFIQPLRGMQSGSAQWNRVDIKEVSSPAIATFSRSFGAQTGNQTGGPVSPVLAIIWSLQTGLGARSRRGRLYIPGVEGSVQNNGLLHTYQQDRSQTAITSIMARFGPNGSSPKGMKLVVWSRKLSDWTQVTSIATRPVWGVQRRRNIGVGI